MPNDGSIIDHGDGHPIERWNPFIGEHGQRDGQDAEPHSTDDQLPYPRNRFNPTSVQEFHFGDDVDASMTAHHHSLGPKRLQAAPGNHNHGGTDSFNIGQWVAWAAANTSWGALAGTAPSIGNGFIEGRYCKIGTLVHYRFVLIAGSGTTFGSGGFSWTFLLPFAAKMPATSTTPCIGSAYGFKGGSANYSGSVQIGTAGDRVLIASHLDANGWYANDPVTWAANSNNYFSFSVTYESATL